MSNVQVWSVILAFAMVLVVTIVAWRKWLPAGPISAILYALAGGGVVLLLWNANMPPQWFEGETWNFVLGGTLMISAFLFHSKEERTIRLPFLFTFGLMLVILNFAAHF